MNSNSFTLSNFSSFYSIICHYQSRCVHCGCVVLVFECDLPLHFCTLLNKMTRFSVLEHLFLFQYVLFLFPNILFLFQNVLFLCQNVLYSFRMAYSDLEHPKICNCEVFGILFMKEVQVRSPKKWGACTGACRTIFEVQT